MNVFFFNSHFLVVNSSVLFSDGEVCLFLFFLFAFLRASHDPHIKATMRTVFVVFKTVPFSTLPDGAIELKK